MVYPHAIAAIVDYRLMKTAAMAKIAVFIAVLDLQDKNLSYHRYITGRRSLRFKVIQGQ